MERQEVLKTTNIQPKVSILTKFHRSSLMDKIFQGTTLTVSIFVVALLFYMIYLLTIQSSLSIKTFGFGFMTNSQWDPVRGQFGALPFIYGTIVSSFIALIVATPISIGIAVYLSEIAPPWISQPVGFLVELLAAIPSIIYGLWGIFVFIPFVRTNIQLPLSEKLGWFPLFSGAPIGIGLLSAGLLLAIMIIPIITAISRDVISAVPRLQREGALALGATKWEVIKYAVLPYAKKGILGGIILGLGRAIGETMAVTMVIGNRAIITGSLFSPAYSMASVIANEFAEATQALHIAAMTHVGLLLFLVTFLFNGFARFLIWSVSKGPEGGIRD